jgi:transcriptional regulator with XRE-family HTH domain
MDFGETTMKIEAQRLRELRARKGWSQKQLARRVGVNEQTIYKAEKAGWPNPRPQTLAKLMQEFAVSEEVLAGTAPLPSASADEEEHEGDFETLRFRVSRETRNAYSLVARRYGVRERLIANLAPVLFAITAEQSLRWRGELLEELMKRMRAVDDAASRLPHLGSSEVSDDDDNLFMLEDISIGQRDILGYFLFGFAEHRKFPSDSEDGAYFEDPFSRFIHDSAKSVGLVVNPRHFDEELVGIALMDEITLIAGEHPELATALSSGSILVRDIPADLLKSERQAERIGWLRERVATGENAREAKKRSNRLATKLGERPTREREESAPDA